jgi:hypothetical protein
MGQLIAHLFGDYVLQNHWMALNKTKSSWACLVHVLLYTLPFLFLTRNPVALTVIAGTHFVIDRFSLAKRWPEFWGVGCDGKVIPFLDELRRLPLYFTCAMGGCPRRPLEPAPPFLAIWLGIIVDNTAHLLINHLALDCLC